MEPDARLRAENAALRAENRRLAEDLARLRRELAAAAAPVPAAPAAVQLRLPLGEPEAAAPAPVRADSPLAARVALLRSLFRGRADVYATRWEHGGRSGYAPAAMDGGHRRGGPWLPLDDRALARHLSGAQTVGVYPLLPDGTCHFLAVDLAGTAWQADAGACLAACAALGVPAALERSRSGSGGHIWTFFSGPVPAASARRLGEVLLIRAMGRRGQMSLRSLDRILPAQDSLPPGGLGGLIALPLQGRAARAGNSLFLDPVTFAPQADPWRFLSEVPCMSAAAVQDLVAAAERAGTLPAAGEGWTAPASGADPLAAQAAQTRPAAAPRPCPLPAEAAQTWPGRLPTRARMALAELARVERAGLPPALLVRLWRLASFPNPEFHRRQAGGLSTWGIPPLIHRGQEDERHIALPRGLAAAARDLLQAQGIAVEQADARSPGAPLDVAFRGSLSPPQQEAASALLPHDCGVLCAPAASGRTAVAAWLIAARRTSTLVLVHRQPLVDQWRGQLATCLGLPPKAIGQFGAGRQALRGQVDIALFHSLIRAGAVADLVAQYGQVVVDECQDVPAAPFERVMAACRPRFVVGLTDAAERRDGLHPIVAMQCGPIRHRLEAQERPPAQVVLRRATGFRLPAGAAAAATAPVDIQAWYGALAADAARNDRIVADAAAVVAEGRTPLVVTERVDHVELLAARLRQQIDHVVVLRAGMGARRGRATDEALAAVPDGAPCALVATGRAAGEGFAGVRPDTLLLAMPVAWWGSVAQHAACVGRPSAGRREVRIYDYADMDVPALAAMYRRRRRAYQALGYQVREGGGDGWTAGSSSM